MHEHRRLNPTVIEKFLHAHDYQLKFVVERRKDFAEIGEILAQLQGVDSAQVMIMAQGTSTGELKRREKWIVESCKLFGYRFTPRLHIQLFGNRRAT
jgi:7-carboxy-7-deazaguanine synthase